MRIAQVAPLYESVPPRSHGGTERVVSNLTEELVKLGHEVTLFASGDSVTDARLVSCCPRALRSDPDCLDYIAPHVVQLEQVFAQSNRFDMIHFHIDYMHFPLSRRHRVPKVTTLHGRLDIPQLKPLYREFSEMPIVSISDAQRRPLAWASWQGTVYHGLPLDAHQFRDGSGNYLAFLGRISPEERVDRAIEIAKRSGMRLKIAAKVEAADRAYFEREIAPLLNHPLIEFVGEIGAAAKDEFLGNAYALLFPIDWPKPFGLVMIEALACGTPVIACDRGSVPEIIDHGVTGYVFDGVRDGAVAVDRVARLSRHVCREVFEERFSARRMAEDYLQVYERVASRRRALLQRSAG